MTALVQVRQEHSCVLSQINAILNRDLELLNEQERTIDRWFDLLGKNIELKDTALELSSLEKKLETLENDLKSAEG